VDSRSSAAVMRAAASALAWVGVKFRSSGAPRPSRPSGRDAKIVDTETCIAYLDACVTAKDWLCAEPRQPSLLSVGRLP
jgi:hypothetical protein